MKERKVLLETRLRNLKRRYKKLIRHVDFQTAQELRKDIEETELELFSLR